MHTNIWQTCGNITLKKKKKTRLGSKPALLLFYKILGKLLSFPDALSQYLCDD